MKKRYLITGILVVLISLAITVRTAHVFGYPILIFVIFLVARTARKRMERDAENKKEEREEQPHWTYQNEGTDQCGQFRQEEQSQAEERSSSPFITCEYCGSLIDTSKHSVCDHCGGSYWDNEEWKNLRNK
ncbi:MAG: hypothetical protein IJ106_09200 [Parasporobacterium sp.]|nr:hypothetical protein [Parasporobacterium sp.]